MKHELVEWLCIDLTIAMVWVQTQTKLSLPKFYAARGAGKQPLMDQQLVFLEDSKD